MLPRKEGIVGYQFKILFKSEEFVVINKPSGFHVHAPETNPEKVPVSKIILQQLRNQLGQSLYPIHRLDVPTSGVLIFALSAADASELNVAFNSAATKKKYWAIVRGYTPESGIIEIDLKSDSSGEFVKAKTKYKLLYQIEIPKQVGLKHSTSRYSWLEIELETGRFHQIRRHMNRISHPVIGDSDHGDSRHNRFFREELKIPGLCLHCVQLEMRFKGVDYVFDAEAPQKWQKIRRLFQI